MYQDKIPSRFEVFFVDTIVSRSLGNIKIRIPVPKYTLMTDFPFAKSLLSVTQSFLILLLNHKGRVILNDSLLLTFLCAKLGMLLWDEQGKEDERLKAFENKVMMKEYI
jgi:hypothetical protein